MTENRFTFLRNKNGKSIGIFDNKYGDIVSVYKMVYQGVLSENPDGRCRKSSGGTGDHRGQSLPDERSHRR